MLCTYLGFHFLDGLLYFIAGPRTFVIISFSFGYRARCGSSVVGNSKKFRVRGNKIVHFVDFGTRRRLTFRHRASCILGQAFHYSPENAFYIFNQQIYFII